MIQATTFDDADALARHAARWLGTLASACAGNFAVSLSGGATPRRLYERLAETQLPWDRMHWFWGDERFVPPDHPDSNFRMARAALLSRPSIPASHIHAIATEGMSPQEAAAAYETTLKRFYGGDTLAPRRPLFDVVLLGLGEDGHTASLFPGQPALDEKRRWAVAVQRAQGPARVTLTYPALESAAETVFLVTGAAKREALHRARAGDPGIPAGRLRPAGNLHWFVDRAAAGE